MTMDISSPAVLGGGSWGTALAHVLACALDTRVTLVARDPDVVAALNERHENVRYLPGIRVHDKVTATLDANVLSRADLVVLAVPCQSLRGVLIARGDQFAPDAILINAAKGIELASLKTPRDIVAEVMPGFAARYGALSGPSFAHEVAASKPTAVVLGCADQGLGKKLRAVFATPYFRSYSSTDVLGVELGGAVKNVMAIAAGLSDGLGFGHNARAALISRCIAEMGRLGAALGAQPGTMAGLSGLGDLVLTCTGDLSRNRQTGMRLGRGESLEHIIATLGSVAEGVKTTASLHALACKCDVEMPIVNAVHAVLYEGIPIHEAVRNLFNRALRDE